MSTTADLILKGGKVVSPDAVIDAAVAIKDGRILAVGTDIYRTRQSRPDRGGSGNQDTRSPA